VAGGWVVRTIVYDTGALLAVERRNPDFLALHDELTAARVRPIVPVVVLAQAWRGGPQHQISRVLKGCDIRSDDEHIGRAAGVACGASGTVDVVDAIVVATAVRYQASVVTSDPEDLKHLADSIGVKLRVFTV
jgi:predicted nucleic acid-binding protein